MSVYHPSPKAANNLVLVLTALFCLRLCRSSGNQVQTGTHRKPSIWADPGPRVPKGDSVTIWCRGPTEASKFRLYKVRDSEWEYMEEFPAHSGQAFISLRNLNVHRAGEYQCSYSCAHYPEQRSDTLTLVLTGLFPAPLLEAHPSPVVPSGRSVSLSCSTPKNMTGTFHLLKEGDAESPHLEPQFSQGSWQANFSLGPVNASHGGNYSCFVTTRSQPYAWSLPSAPLRLQVTRTPPIPSIWADPSPRIPRGGSVTIWCRGPPEASEFRLYKLWDFKLEYMVKSLDHIGQAYISLQNANIYRTGQYLCSYSSAHHPEQFSDTLTLVLTGLFTAPWIKAHQSPVVALGGNVSLSCSSTWRNMTGTFHLLKEGDAEPRHLEPQFSQGRWQASFSLGPMKASYGGNYSCYFSASFHSLFWSLPSTPLHLQVTGVFNPPSLSAQPGPLVQSGDPVTLQCHSQKFSIFALTKDDTPPHNLHGQSSPDFPLGPVSASHGGRYRCFGGHDLVMWSEPSDPLDILVAETGTGSSPELWALPEPNVPAGGDVTLLCHSANSANTFYLAQEGSAAEPLQCLLPHPASQANFTLQPTQNITYRCYISNSSGPHLLSPPSKPLQLLISGPGSQLPDYTVQNLIRIGMAGCVLLLLVLLLFEAHHSRNRSPYTVTR